MMLDDLPARFNQVLFVHNMITVKHGTRLMTGNPHGHFFRNPGPHKISNPGAPEIMK